MTTPLRIGLIMQGDRSWVGGTEYIKNIIFALAQLPPETRSTFEICLIADQPFDSDSHDQIRPYLSNLYHREADLEPFTLRNRIRWKTRRSLLKQHDPRFDDFLKKANIDFVYPYFTQDEVPTPYRSAAWIYDFQHKHLPQFFTKQQIEARDREFARIAKYASTVVLSSETAASEFQKFFPEAAHKSGVLPFKVSPSSAWYENDPGRTQRTYSLPDRFFIISNQFWQHKNHLVVFEALKLLRERAIHPVVVCTGHIYDYRKSDYSDEILQTIHKFGIARQVYLLGLIPKFDQIQLMRRSLAVIQPSLFEGWSTVVEDARALGKRIILSDIPVHVEQNPPGNRLFERNSPESLALVLADWWHLLSPGPDAEQEASAKDNSVEEVKAFADRFLKIAGGNTAAHKYSS